MISLQGMADNCLVKHSHIVGSLSLIFLVLLFYLKVLFGIIVYFENILIVGNFVINSILAKTITMHTVTKQ